MEYDLSFIRFAIGIIQNPFLSFLLMKPDVMTSKAYYKAND